MPVKFRTGLFLSALAAVNVFCVAHFVRIDLPLIEKAVLAFFSGLQAVIYIGALCMAQTID